eukprot:5986109-Amphidinium_carterae.1
MWKRIASTKEHPKWKSEEKWNILMQTRTDSPRTVAHLTAMAQLNFGGCYFLYLVGCGSLIEPNPGQTNTDNLKVERGTHQAEVMDTSSLIL